MPQNLYLFNILFGKCPSKWFWPPAPHPRLPYSFQPPFIPSFPATLFAFSLYLVCILFVDEKQNAKQM